MNTDPDLNPLVASPGGGYSTVTGEEMSAAPSEPLSVDHSSEHRLSPSISCHDKATGPRIELRVAIQ